MDLLLHINDSNSLRCIHLSGNIDVTEEFVEQTREMIGASPSIQVKQSEGPLEEDDIEATGTILPWKSIKRSLYEQM